MKKTLLSLLKSYGPVSNTGIPETPVSGVCSHPKRLEPNNIFFYFIVDLDLRTEFTDYRYCISTAIKAGAIAVVIDPDYDADILYDPNKIQEEFGNKTRIIEIKNIARYFGSICHEFYNHPTQQLDVIAVTGSSGKTSSTHFITHLVNALEPNKSGIVGTLGYGIPSKALVYTGFTTPDADVLTMVFKEYVQNGIKIAAIEASSQGIDFGRLNGTVLRTAIFLNLSPDHLDHHKTMEEYFRAKAQLFLFPDLKYAIVNVDDPYGIRLINEIIPKTVKIYGISTKHPNKIIPFDNDCVTLVFASDIYANLKCITARIHSPWGYGNFNNTNILGDFNIYNLLASITACCLQGYALDLLLDATPKLNSVIGRMNIFRKHGISVIVDFAHTPAQLDMVLSFASKFAPSLTCVFGCGGKRDKSKRPIMAGIAEKYAKKIYLTNNITRGEPPIDIANDTLAGFTNTSDVTVMLSRPEAITVAIMHSEVGEIILIAGRGHEQYTVDGKFETDGSIVRDILTSKYFADIFSNTNATNQSRLKAIVKPNNNLANTETMSKQPKSRL